MKKRWKIWIALTVPAVLFAIPSSIAAGEPAEVESPAAEIAEEDETIWTFSARIRPRIEGRLNHHFGLDEGDLNYPFQPDEADQFTQQSRLGVAVEREQLRGQLTVQHAATWGDFGGNELTAPPLTVYEAWINYQPHDLLFVDVGRFELAYGDQRVLGAVGWSQVGRTWDGVRARIRPHETVAIDAFAARYVDGEAGFAIGDSYLTGFYASVFEPLEDVVEVVDIYVLHDITDLGRSEAVYLMMVGSRVEVDVGQVDTTAEGGYQFDVYCEHNGHDCRGVEGTSVRAFFFDTEAGYTVATHRPFVGVSMASGDDPESDRFGGYDQLYPTGHAWLGFMDLIGPRTNLFELRAGLGGQIDRFTYRLTGHHFTRLQPTSESVGVELNLKIFAKLTDGLDLGVGGGVFLPAGGISVNDASPQGVAAWNFAQLVGVF